jgi:hypothetical protein
MRMLVYDCYNNGTEVMTVKTYREATEWKSQHRLNTVKERLVNFSDKKEETKEMREKRIARMERVIKALSQHRRNAVV